MFEADGMTPDAQQAWEVASPHRHPEVVRARGARRDRSWQLPLGTRRIPRAGTRRSNIRSADARIAVELIVVLLALVAAAPAAG